MAITGLSCRRLASASVTTLLALTTPDAGHAESAVQVHIAATTLDRALLQLSLQTGIDIVSTEPGLSRINIPTINGRLKAANVLNRLLAGSGYRAKHIRGGYRVVVDTSGHKARSHADNPPTGEASKDIIVTASKQRVDLRRYPGSINIVDLAARARDGSEAGDDDMIAQSMPIIERTALGPGRNKLFVRGIADSSFTGATQSTVSVYFGDVQLAYSGADPDIKLVDVARVEVLEGPQGTLYGAGSIGGIVRITPNPVDLSAIHASATAGGSTTIGGAPGFDTAAMVNVPLMDDKLAVRAVGYRSRDGGYIDDPLRGLTDINHTDTVGGRLAMTAKPGDGWTIDGGVLLQMIDTDDTSYTYLGGPPLARRSRLAQPFSSRIFQARLAIAKHWADGLELYSTTGFVDYQSNEAFDASTPAKPTQIYLNSFDNQLLTQETRLSHTGTHSNWVVGFALLQNTNAQNRALGPIGMPEDIVGVTNIARSASIFGEFTLTVLPRLRATLGVRGTIGGNEAMPSDGQSHGGFFGGQETKRADPTLALTYRVDDALSLYARYQTGYRTGGLAVARGVGRVAEFAPDSITMLESGFRFRRGGLHPLTLGAAIAYAHWTNIQADLFSRAGQPFTTNLGDAQILSVEANASWEPIVGLHGEASVLFAQNEVTGPIADTSVRGNRRLAQVPNIAANAALGYHWKVGARDTIDLGMNGQYIGRALLGTGDFLDISHPDYLRLGASVTWTRGHVATSLSAENLLNSQTNQFSLGNPLILASRDQLTPLRPLTVRLGVSVGW